MLERDQPLLTTESTVHYDANATRAQLSLLQAAGYDSYLIEEIAGMRADVRNLLHVPRSRKGSFVGSNALDLAVAAKVLFAVTPRTIASFAFPCCRRGGECCPVGPSGKLARNTCCMHWKVHEWLREALQLGLDDTRRFTRTTWYDEKWLQFAAHGSAAQRWQVEAVLARNRSHWGFQKGVPW